MPPKSKTSSASVGPLQEVKSAACFGLKCLRSCSFILLLIMEARIRTTDSTKQTKQIRSDLDDRDNREEAYLDLLLSSYLYKKRIPPKCLSCGKNVFDKEIS